VTDVSPADHHPDEASRYCPHCGDLTADPTRCPGWLRHRARVRFHAEAWEHGAWTGIVGANDSLGYVVAQRDHKLRRFPGIPMRLVGVVTRDIPIADPADRHEEMRQLLDGDDSSFTAFMGRAWGYERDRAIAAETRVRELEVELAALRAALLAEPPTADGGAVVERCTRCGHGKAAHNVSGCLDCPGGWRAGHRFTQAEAAQLHDSEGDGQ
jgi:hypothetical protein